MYSGGVPDRDHLPSAPRADALRNRRRVLDAANRVFAEHGPTATLNDVAREAGVGVGTVYRKFPSKDALLDELFQTKIEQLVALADQARQDHDPVLAFRRFVLGVMQARATDRALGAVVMRARHGESFAAALGRRMEPHVARLIDQAQVAGGLRAGFTGQDVCVLAVMVGTVADHTRDVDPDAWRRYAQLLVDGTRPSASAEPLSPRPLTLGQIAAGLSRAP